MGVSDAVAPRPADRLRSGGRHDQGGLRRVDRGAVVLAGKPGKDFAAARKPAGSLTASSVKVGLTKVNGAWLIYAFDPV